MRDARLAARFAWFVSRSPSPFWPKTSFHPCQGWFHHIGRSRRSLGWGVRRLGAHPLRDLARCPAGACRHGMGAPSLGRWGGGRHPLSVEPEVARIARLEGYPGAQKAGANATGTVPPGGGPSPGRAKKAKDRFAKCRPFWLSWRGFGDTFSDHAACWKYGAARPVGAPARRATVLGAARFLRGGLAGGGHRTRGGREDCPALSRDAVLRCPVASGPIPKCSLRAELEASLRRARARLKAAQAQAQAQAGRWGLGANLRRIASMRCRCATLV